MSFLKTAAGVASLFLLAFNAKALAGAAASTQAETVEQQIEKARTAISREDYEGAKRVLKYALSLKKDSAEACLLLARVHRVEGESDDALKYVKKAIASNPLYVEAQALYARLLFEAGRFEQARKQMVIALELRPKDPNAYVLDGEMYLQARKYKEAVGSFEKAIVLASASDAGKATLQARVEAIRSYLAFKAQDEKDPATKRAVMKTRPRPNYPEEARKAGIQGIVILGILVSDTGVVVDHIVLSGLSHGLTLEAVNAARRMTFWPALREGKPVPYWTPVEVEFKLK